MSPSSCVDKPGPDLRCWPFSNTRVSQHSSGEIRLHWRPVPRPWEPAAAWRRCLAASALPPAEPPAAVSNGDSAGRADLSLSELPHHTSHEETLVLQSHSSISLLLDLFSKQLPKAADEAPGPSAGQRPRCRPSPERGGGQAPLRARDHSRGTRPRRRSALRNTSWCRRKSLSLRQRPSLKTLRRTETLRETDAADSTPEPWPGYPSSAGRAPRATRALSRGTIAQAEWKPGSGAPGLD